MDYQYGSNVQAVMNDPNGTPGQTRGGVDASVSMPPAIQFNPYVGHGPPPLPQNSSVPNPLDEAFSEVGPGE